MASIQSWGNSTWYLFHGIAEKIIEDKFLLIKNDFIKLIKLVCNNLPCPECREHAVKVLEKVKFDNIKSKYDMKIFLFQFHNLVNKRKNTSLFLQEELDNKYKDINMPNIYMQFFNAYSINNKSPKMMMYTSFKNIFLKDVKQLIIKINNFLIK